MPCPRLIITLLAAPLACGTSPGTTTGDASTTTAVESTAESTAESTGSHGTQATHDESTTTHEESTAATHDEPTTTAYASTTEHTTGSTGHHGSEVTGDSTATTGELSPVDAYCACMLVQCHDQYHGTWGEEHESSEAMCVAAAEALPSVGMPVTMGNSLECRQYYCELGEAEPGACDSAIGGGACV